MATPVVTAPLSSITFTNLATLPRSSLSAVTNFATPAQDFRGRPVFFGTPTSPSPVPAFVSRLFPSIIKGALPASGPSSATDAVYTGSSAPSYYGALETFAERVSNHLGKLNFADFIIDLDSPVLVQQHKATVPGAPPPFGMSFEVKEMPLYQALGLSAPSGGTATRRYALNSAALAEKLGPLYSDLDTLLLNAGVEGPLKSSLGEQFSSNITKAISDDIQSYLATVNAELINLDSDKLSALRTLLGKQAEYKGIRDFNQKLNENLSAVDRAYPAAFNLAHRRLMDELDRYSGKVPNSALDQAKRDLREALQSYRPNFHLTKDQKIAFYSNLLGVDSLDMADSGRLTESFLAERLMELVRGAADVGNLQMNLESLQTRFSAELKSLENAQKNWDAQYQDLRDRLQQMLREAASPNAVLEIERYLRRLDNEYRGIVENLRNLEDEFKTTGEPEKPRRAIEAFNNRVMSLFDDISTAVNRSLVQPDGTPVAYERGFFQDKDWRGQPFRTPDHYGRLLLALGTLGGPLLQIFMEERRDRRNWRRTLELEDRRFRYLMQQAQMEHQMQLQQLSHYGRVASALKSTPEGSKDAGTPVGNTDISLYQTR